MTHHQPVHQQDYRFLDLLPGLLLTTLLTLMMPSQAVPATSDRTLLILGDSISSGHGLAPATGWVTLLKQRLRAKSLADGSNTVVINASISGDTTASGLRRLPALLQRYHPVVTVIELGGNDGLRGLPLPVIKHNLAAMIEQAQKSASKVLLLGMRIPPNYGRRYTEAFHAIYLQLREQYPIALLPFLLEGVGGHPQLMQADGIHPNLMAQSRLLDLVWPRLIPLLQ